MAEPLELTVKQFWPTNFYQRTWPEHSAHAPEIIGHLYAVRAKATAAIASGVAPAAKSGHGLFESEFDLFADSHPGLDRLKAFIGQSAQMAAAHANGANVDHRRLRVTIVDSWFHITNDGGFHDAHYHSGCSWCGIYYLQAGDSGRTASGGAPNGGNRFYSPFPSGGAFRDFGNSYLNVSYVDPPVRDGLLILFPSYLLHSALPYRGEKDRIVISFNAQVTLPD